MVDSVQIYSARFCLPGGWVVEPILVTSQVGPMRAGGPADPPKKTPILHKTQWASLLIWKNPGEYVDSENSFCSFGWWLNPIWSHLYPFVDDGNIDRAHLIDW